MTDHPVLEVRDVAKYFGSVIALSNISTTVRAGQVTCVLGDNGAGKSTFIKILAGVHNPDEGELLIDGRPVMLTNPRLIMSCIRPGVATMICAPLRISRACSVMLAPP